jgi:hypothetical protein
VLESTSLVLRKYDYLPGPLGKSLEQPSRPPFSVDWLTISAAWLLSNHILAERCVLKSDTGGLRSYGHRFFSDSTLCCVSRFRPYRRADVSQ